jgi:hypothetical protein
VFACERVCVFVCVCVLVCMCVCVSVFVFVHMHACVRVCMHAHARVASARALARARARMSATERASLSRRAWRSRRGELVVAPIGSGAVARAHVARGPLLQLGQVPAGSPARADPLEHVPLRMPPRLTKHEPAIRHRQASVIGWGLANPRTQLPPELLQRRAAAFAAVARTLRPRCFLAFDRAAEVDLSAGVSAHVTTRH